MKKRVYRNSSRSVEREVGRGASPDISSECSAKFRPRVIASAAYVRETRNYETIRESRYFRISAVFIYARASTFSVVAAKFTVLRVTNVSRSDSFLNLSVAHAWNLPARGRLAINSRRACSPRLSHPRCSTRTIRFLPPSPFFSFASAQVFTWSEFHLLHPRG